MFLVPKNFLHRKFVEQFRSLIQDDMERLDENLNLTKVAYDDTARSVEYDSRNNALHYFEIAITYKLLG